MVKPLKVLKIDAGAQGGFIEFSPSAKVDPEKFIKLIQQIQLFIALMVH